MTNMSYCKFQNTLQDLRDVSSDMSADNNAEKVARKKLIQLCKEIAEEYGDANDGDFGDDNEDDDEE